MKSAYARLLEGASHRLLRRWRRAACGLTVFLMGCAAQAASYQVDFAQLTPGALTPAPAQSSASYQALSVLAFLEDAPLTLLEPNSGELAGGAVYDFSWHADLNRAGSGVRFELWRAGSRLLDLGYGWNATGLGTSALLLPDLPAGADYRVRVISTWDGSIHDDSDEPLHITGSPVRVLAPNGGEVWQAGGTHFVWWKSNTLIAGTAVDLELWHGGSFIADLGSAWDPDGEGLTAITLPAAAGGAGFSIRAVSSYDPGYEDFCDEAFSITGGNSTIQAAEWMLLE